MQLSFVHKLSSQCSAAILGVSSYAPQAAGSVLRTYSSRGASAVGDTLQCSPGFRVLSSDSGQGSGLRRIAKALKLHKPRPIDEKMQRLRPLPVNAAGADLADEASVKGGNTSEVPPASVSSPPIASIVPDFIDFLNTSWTQYHATEEAKRLLLAAGYCQLSEREEWSLAPGGNYFFTRHLSSLVAFSVGSNYRLGNPFTIIGAHTDSPCPKLKPHSALSKLGFLLVGVQLYGGGLWHTWFDRDLSVAGRVLVRSRDGRGGVENRLVKIPDPILRISTLAIHLDRSVNTDGFKPNLETHLAPLLATVPKDGAKEEGGKGEEVPKPHHALLVKLIASQLECDPEDILDVDLNICDTQPSCVGGGRGEFIFSGRLDNLASSFCALRALIDSRGGGGEEGVRMVALFDHEEVGSTSTNGAGSPTLFHSVRRAVNGLGGVGDSHDVVERTLQRSFIVSADMAHAVHPLYGERHEEHHQPRLGGGLVVKHNANQRYATSMLSSYAFKEIGRRRGIPTQSFAVRNDMGCGSTIGPILAAGLGIRTVDVGMPQLSMHSVREMCGTEDVDIAYLHFKAFFEDFCSLEAHLDFDKPQ